VCFCCRRVRMAVGVPLAPVVPLSLCLVPGPLHTLLRAYKDAHVPEARRRGRTALQLLLAAFLRRHEGCIAALIGGRADLYVPVPPSQRPGPPPLEELTRACELSQAAWAPGLLCRGRGALGHLRASARGFGVDPGRRRMIEGRRVVLVDDTLTTGARAQSTAVALRTARARTAVVVLGRVLRPDRNPAHARYWRAYGGLGWDLASCCVEVPAAAVPQLPMWSAGMVPSRPA
jgi:hypothetical protein